MSQEQGQFQFDQILVAKSTSNSSNAFNYSNASSVTPATLAYDRKAKAIYAGPSANWKLNFKDLFSIGVENTTTSTGGQFANDQRSSHHHHHHHHRHNGRGGGGMTYNGGEILTLTLSGRKISLKCIARFSSTTSNSRGGGSRGGNDQRQQQLDEFIEGLKSVHRKMTSKEQMKHYDDDFEYNDYNDGKQTTKKLWGDARVESSSFRNRQHPQQQLQARKRLQVVTPAQPTNNNLKSQSLYLPSHEKKHPTSGVFSPSRPSTTVTKCSSSTSSMRHTDHRSNVGGSMRRNAGSGGGGYAYYDPAMEEEEEEDEEDDDMMFQDDEGHHSKDKKHADTESVIVTGNVVSSPSSLAVRKLNLPSKSPRGASPVKFRKTMSKLPSRRLAVGSSGRQLHGISGGTIRLREKTASMLDEFDYRDEEEEEGTDEEGSVGATQIKAQEDNAGDEDRAGVNEGKSRCRKKLRLSIDDDEEDEDEEIVHPKGKNKSRMSIDDDEEDYDDDEGVVNTTGEDMSKATQDASNDLDEKTNNSVADDASKEKIPPKTRSIANFFAPRTKKSATTLTESRRDSSPTETYGATLLSTPSKKVQPEEREDIRSTSPQPSITPVPKMTQRKLTSSKYFSSTSYSKEVLSPPPSPQTLKYSSEDDGDGDDREEEVESNYLTTQDRIRKNRNVYGRSGRFGLGQSRLGARLEASNNYPHRGPSSSNSLDFGSYKATSSAFNSVQRGLYMNKAVSPPGSSSPSKADLALGSGRKSTTTSGNIVIRRPLNNHENEPPAKAPTSTAIPGIQNLGNTCYLSASLQTLFGIPSFIADLYRMYEEARSATTSTEETMPLTRALLEVAVVIGVLAEDDASCIRPEAARNKLTSSLAANPSALKQQMDVLTDKFAGYEQRDAHEFLSDLVDFLHDELTASKSTPPPPPLPESSETEATHSTTQEGGRSSPKENKHPNEVDGKAGLDKNSAIKCHAPLTTAVKHNNEDLPTDAYFHLNVRVCLECDSCGYSRFKDEMYRHLSVDVGEDSELDTWTVERSLKQFFQPEKREVKCEKCQSGTTATQTMEVLSRPKALLLHFKRFIVTQEQKVGPVGQNADGTSAPPVMEMVLRKNKAKILLEETLSIGPFRGNSNQILPRKYHLRGVVHHVGNTAFSGHYTTCAKRTLKGRESDTADATNAQDNEDQWVLFDDRVGTRRPASYVLENERNQRNCYMALYELK